MANLKVVAVNTKRKDAEVAGHGFSIFLDAKRVKLQDEEPSVMMEEEEPLADGGAPAAPTMSMPSPALPTQGREAVNDCAANTASASGIKRSEPTTFSADQAAPMDVEVEQQQRPDLEQQQQPKQRDPFFPGFF